MATSAQILASISAWDSNATPIAEKVLAAMSQPNEENQFAFYVSSGDVYYAIVDVVRNIAYIDAPVAGGSTDQAREMISIQRQFVNDYPDMDLIINIERIVPRLTDLISLDLLKLAVITKKVRKIYIIGNQDNFRSFVTAAINIHKKVVDEHKFERYEGLEDLPEIISKIEADA